VATDAQKPSIGGRPKTLQTQKERGGLNVDTGRGPRIHWGGHGRKSPIESKIVPPKVGANKEKLKRSTAKKKTSPAACSNKPPVIPDNDENARATTACSQKGTKRLPS